MNPNSRASRRRALRANLRRTSCRKAQRASVHVRGPRNYIASILAGENSVKELHALAQPRSDRMAARVRGIKAERSEAHRAAAAWACEMTSLEQAAERMGDRKIGWEDFDRMLDDMPEALARTAEQFGFRHDRAQIEAIANGPLMRRYSKASEYDYSPALRRELIAQTERQHAADIGEALAMLERAAQESPFLARALTRSASEA